MNQTFVFLVEVWRVLLCFLCSVYLPMTCLLILLLLEPGFLVLSTFSSSFLWNFVFYLLLLLLTHPPTPSKRYLLTATLPPSPPLRYYPYSKSQSSLHCCIHRYLIYLYICSMSCLCYLQPFHTQSGLFLLHMQPISGMFLVPFCDCRGMAYPSECGRNSCELCGIFSYSVSLWLSGIGVGEGVREVQMFFGRRYQNW